MSNLIAKNSASDSFTVVGYSVFSVNNENTVIVDVVNGNNEKYHAFNCTINGVDYYFVVDGVQTQWTGNLSSIGYSLYVDKNYEFILFDESSNKIIYGVESISDMVFSPTGYFLINNTDEIVFVEQFSA